ncbi:hypothetical protein HHI36_003035 [Cryptolaemus montrouzieri]|uniref:Uncharacterized protein n=1 Tax=Cryptolaemus montrouzieri TaxID=559131 RepID=A0ABD2PD18_9CUCU
MIITIVPAIIKVDPAAKLMYNQGPVPSIPPLFGSISLLCSLSPGVGSVLKLIGSLILDQPLLLYEDTRIEYSCAGSKFVMWKSGAFVDDMLATGASPEVRTIVNRCLRP